MALRPQDPRQVAWSGGDSAIFMEKRVRLLPDLAMLGPKGAHHVTVTPRMAAAQGACPLRH